MLFTSPDTIQPLTPPEILTQLPARMINEFTYCPRLFYLEYIQQEFAHSADTIDGRFVHRRVDREAGDVPDEISAEPKLHSRSVLIGSDALGAIARIDVLESDDGRLIPVDYKRGAAPNADYVPAGAYDPERVQVCVQGLLLREEGYQCDYGVLYFAASQTRVTVDFTDELIALTHAMIQQARAVMKSGTIPPPLIDSPKCPRCSLAAICLPDEVNALAVATPPVEDFLQFDAILVDENLKPIKKEVRRLMPARDDCLPVYVQGQGFGLGLKGDVLEIRDKGKVVNQARLMEASQLSLFGNVQLTAQALRALAKREIPILHLSYGGWLTAITTPPPHKNIELRRRQFQVADDEALSLQIARAFTVGKIRNQRTLLRRNAEALPAGVLSRMAEWRRKAERADSLPTLLGLEGIAARDYFANFALMFKSSEDVTAFEFTSRNRRPPRDPVNAMLSFLYSLLVKEMVVAAIGVGFDPYLGFYHQPRYGRPALALDLMEEFRPLIADSVVISLINNGEIRPQDFITRAHGCALTDSGRKRVIEAFERRLDTLVTHPIFGYAVSYRRIFEIQTRLLARFLAKEIPQYPAFVTR